MFGALFEFVSPCATLRASNCYILRAHKTRAKCWVMLCIPCEVNQTLVSGDKFDHLKAIVESMFDCCFLRGYNVFNNSSLASQAKGVDSIHWSQEDDSIGQECVQVWAPKFQDLVRVGLHMTILSKFVGLLIGREGGEPKGHFTHETASP